MVDPGEDLGGDLQHYEESELEKARTATAKVMLENFDLEKKIEESKRQSEELSGLVNDADAEISRLLAEIDEKNLAIFNLRKRIEATDLASEVAQLDWDADPFALKQAVAELASKQTAICESRKAENVGTSLLNGTDLYEQVNEYANVDKKIN